MKEYSLSINDKEKLVEQIVELIFDELIVSESKPEDYSPNGPVEGELSATPEQFVFLLLTNEEYIPEVIEISTTFIPWYAADETIHPKEYGYDDQSGANVSLILASKEEKGSAGFECRYSVLDIEEFAL